MILVLDYLNAFDVSKIILENSAQKIIELTIPMEYNSLFQNENESLYVFFFKKAQIVKINEIILIEKRVKITCVREACSKADWVFPAPPYHSPPTSFWIYSIVFFPPFIHSFIHSFFLRDSNERREDVVDRFIGDDGVAAHIANRVGSFDSARRVDDQNTRERHVHCSVRFHILKFSEL